MFEVKIIAPSCNYSDALLVRDLVFSKEQGFRAPDADANDPIATHVIIYDADKPVATGRVFQDSESTCILGRIAVLREYRGTGLGRTLMEALERAAVALGAKQLKLGAQMHAVAFYEKCGFVPTGERYMDEFCEHAHMEKKIED